MTTESVSAEALLRLHRDSVLNTPWGPAQTAEHIGGDSISVTTAGHGGILLGDESWQALPAEVRACLFADEGWAEEDCDAPIVLAVLVDKGIVGIEHMPWLGDGDEGKANLYNVARRVAAGFPQYHPCLKHLPAVPPAPPEGGSGEAAGSLVISRLNEATEIEWSMFIQMDEGERPTMDKYLDFVLSEEIDELRDALTVGQGQLKALEAEAAKRGLPNPPAGGERDGVTMFSRYWNDGSEAAHAAVSNYEERGWKHRQDMRRMVSPIGGVYDCGCPVCRPDAYDGASVR